MKYFWMLVSGALVLAACDKKGSGSADLKNDKDSLAYAVGVIFAQGLDDGDLKDLDYTMVLKAMQDFRDSTEAMDVNAADMYINEYMMAAQERKNEENKVANEKWLEENKAKEGVQTTATGLQYKVIQEGSGVKPDANDSVTVHYHGTLIDGTVFDSSKEIGEPATFALNRVVPGWTEGFQLMSEGGKYMLYVPSELGYGRRGAGGIIKPMSTLIFEVELIKVTKVD